MITTELLDALPMAVVLVDGGRRISCSLSARPPATAPPP
jgi:hypothetical protein